MTIVDIINNCSCVEKSFMEDNKDISSAICKLCCIPCLATIQTGQCEEIRKYIQNNGVIEDDEF